MLKIKHIAHSCFVIENGKEKLIIDPFDNSIGYDPIKETVNYILSSHAHHDHNYIENITLNKNSGTFKIETVKSYHDEEKGAIRGENTIHIIDTGDVKIAHLGDLGHVLTDEQLEHMKDIDVLLIPVGGNYTIDYKNALVVVDQINPKTIIPMHYKTSKSKIDIDFPDNFLNGIEKSYEIVKINKDEIEYKKSDKNIVFII
ncbi:MAG: MBL fold metallo-hydrolase [Fusobacteriaceae bacterium]|jgi:L-ascorbate metabolism protein UlaG (beta-lactamase superfamily)|nr:MBL fold metallo-hydrolase [Fusobacteriaceae bacterium]